MRYPSSFTIHEDAISIDGVKICLAVIPQFLYELAHPDPRKWYRLERVGENIVVHVRITEDSDGTPIANTGDALSREGSGGEGQETQGA